MRSRCSGRSVRDGRIIDAARSAARSSTPSWNHRCATESLGARKVGLHVLARLEDLAVDDRERGDLLVPLEKRRPAAAQPVSEAIELPHGIDYRPDVGVQEMSPEVRV